MRIATFKLKQHWFTRRFRWQAKAANNKIIGFSRKSYKNETDCKQDVIRLTLAIANDKPIFYKDKSNQWRWQYTDKYTDEIIGASSEGYKNKKDSIKNISDVEAVLVNAQI